MHLNKNYIVTLFLLVLLSLTVHGAVLGFSDIQLKDNQGTYDKAWVVTWVDDDFTTDNINAYFSKEEIESGSGYVPKDDLKISIDGRNNYCDYEFDITRFQDRNIYTIELVKQSFWKWEDENNKLNWANKNCNDFSRYPSYEADFQLNGDITQVRDTGVAHMPGVFTDTVYCAKTQEKIGTVGEAINQKIVTESLWSVKAGDKVAQTKLVSNSGSLPRTTNIGDDVIIQWQGALSTGDSCPSLNRVIGIHNNNFGWKLVQEDSYDSYFSSVDTIRDQISDWAKSFGSETQKLNIETAFNNDARKVVSDISPLDYNIINTDLNSGKIRFDLDNTISFPVFRLIIDADYLELEITYGVPKIVSVSDLEFNEGETTGTGQVTVKNIGSKDGGFNVRVFDCTDGFSSSFSQGTGVLRPNEEKILSFSVVGSDIGEDAKVTGSCKVEMKESYKQTTDIKGFDVIMTQISECTPGQKVCGFEGELHAVKKCNSEGTKNVVFQLCTEDAICQNLECVAKKSSNDDESSFSLTFLIITLVIALITSIVAGVYTKPLTFFKIKKFPIGKILRLAIIVIVFILTIFVVVGIVNSIIALFSLPFI